MASMHEKYEFPCGLKVEVSTRAFFGVGYFYLEDIECPLHGKHCPKFEQKNKGELK